MNAFEQLGFEPRPWLDGGEITQSFHQRAARLHPDRDGGDADSFATLNAAYLLIREPDTRLKHLLAITHTGLPDGPKRLAEADLFMEIGGILQTASRLRADMANASTPLRRALLSREASQCRQGIRRMQEAVARKWQESLAALEALDQAWPDVPAGDIVALSESLTFLKRWRLQLESAEADLGA